MEDGVEVETARATEGETAAKAPSGREAPKWISEPNFTSLVREHEPGLARIAAGEIEPMDMVTALTNFGEQMKRGVDPEKGYLYVGSWTELCSDGSLPRYHDVVFGFVRSAEAAEAAPAGNGEKVCVEHTFDLPIVWTGRFGRLQVPLPLSAIFFQRAFLVSETPLLTVGVILDGDVRMDFLQGPVSVRVGDTSYSTSSRGTLARSSSDDASDE
jgi:hypothetical protein